MPTYLNLNNGTDLSRLPPIDTIDLSLLPAPDVIEQVDYERLFGEMLTKLVSLDSDFAEVLESDPAAKVLQSGAFTRMLDRQRVNEAALAVMLAYARGRDLDRLGQLWGTERLTVGVDAKGRPAKEIDDRFRRRIRYAAEAQGAAGSPGAYCYWALTLAPQITDASAVHISPGNVRVTMLGTAADGRPAPADLAVVRSAFGDPKNRIRPLTDAVSVTAPDVVPYALKADIWILPGPDSNLVMDKVKASYATTKSGRRRLGVDMPSSVLHATLQQHGVSRVDIETPSANVIVRPWEFAVESAAPVLRLAGRTI